MVFRNEPKIKFEDDVSILDMSEFFGETIFSWIDSSAAQKIGIFLAEFFIEGESFFGWAGKKK